MNRYYDPELGRFISADPLGYVDGPSMYGFASNSPVNFSDPLGLNPWDCKVEGEGACELLQEALAYFATIREQERQEQLAQERVEVAEVLAQAGPEKGVRPHARTSLSRFFRSKGLSLEQVVAKVNSYLGPAGSCPEPVDQLGCELGGGVNALIEPYTMLYTQLVGELLGGLAVPESTLYSYLTSPARAVSRGGVPTFRVQGGVLPNASKVRFVVDDAGRLSISSDDMLFINVNQEARAVEFLARRGETASLVRFELRPGFVERLRSTAVRQELGRLNPTLPQRVDVTVAPDQFGIPSNMFDELLQNVVPGSVRVTNP